MRKNTTNKCKCTVKNLTNIKTSGFTLIELIVTIVVLSILLVIAVMKIGNVIDDAKRGAFKSTNSMIVSQVKRLNALEIIPKT